MESKKKSTCGCFGFLRRKEKKTGDKPFSSSFKAESVVLVQENLPEQNSSVNRSLSLQKPIPYQPRMSTIIHPPSSRNVFFPSVIPENLLNFNNTVDTAVSGPKTLKDVPINSAVSQGNKSNSDQGVNDSGLGVNSSVKDFKNPGLGVNSSEQGVMNSGLGVNSSMLGVKNSGLGVNNSMLGVKNSGLGVKNSMQGVNLEEQKLVLNENKNPFLVVSSGPSPDWLAGTSKFVSPTLGSIDLSPVKMNVFSEDCSDIFYMLSGTHSNVPDIFIRSNLRPSLMPILKPTTPCYFTKRRVFALPRQEKPCNYALTNPTY